MKKVIKIFLFICFSALFCIVFISCSSSGKDGGNSFDNVYTCVINSNGQEIKYELTFSSGKATLAERTEVSYVVYHGTYSQINENVYSVTITDSSDGSLVPSYLKNAKITITSSSFVFDNHIPNSSVKEPTLPSRPDIPVDKPEVPVVPPDSDKQDDEIIIIYPIEPTKPVVPDNPDDPAKPDEPNDPVDPKDPAKPDEPDDPVDPEDPDGPIGPEEKCKHGATTLQGKIDATCEKDGYCGDLVCSLCGEVIKEGNTTVALGHEYVRRKCIRCEKVNLDGTYFEQATVVNEGSEDSKLTETKTGRTLTINGNSYVMTIKIVTTEKIPARATNDEELTFIVGESEIFSLPTDNGFVETVAENCFMYERTANGVTERFVLSSDRNEIRGATGYYERITERQSLEQGEGVIDETAFTIATELEILSLSAESDEFVVANKITFLTVTYVNGEEITKDKVREGEEYTIRTGELSRWYTETNEYRAGEALTISADVTFYASVTDVFDYDEERKEYVYVKRLLNSTDAVDVRSVDGMEFGGWTNENGEVTSISSHEAGRLRAYAIYIRKTKFSPSEDADGKIVTETLTITGVSEDEKKIPFLSKQNGYSFEITECPTEEKDGVGKYKNERYGDYEVIVPKLCESDYATTKILPTLASDGKVVYSSEIYGEFTVTVPRLNATDYRVTVISEPTKQAKGRAKYASEKHGEFDADIPELNDENYTISRNAPTEENDGEEIYAHDVYGRFKRVIPKLDEGNYVKTEIVSATLLTNGKAIYKNDEYGEYEVETPTLRKSTFENNGKNYEIDLDKKTDNLIIDGEKITAKILLSSGEITFIVTNTTTTESRGRKVELKLDDTFVVYDESAVTDSETLVKYTRQEDKTYGSYKKTKYSFIQIDGKYGIFDTDSGSVISDYEYKVEEDPQYLDESAVYTQSGLHMSFVSGFGVIYSADLTLLPKCESGVDFDNYVGENVYMPGERSLTIKADGTYMLKENGESAQGNVKVAEDGTTYLMTSESESVTEKRTFVYRIENGKETLEEKE